MNDDRIIEYLRSRTNVEPPLDLVSSIMNDVDTTPPRRTWFAALLPSAAVLAAAAVVIVVGIVVFDQRGVGDPATSGGPKPTTSAPTSAAPSPASLVEPGATLRIPASDSDGEWGSIELERRPDLGGYPDAEVSPDAFVIEIEVTYSLTRLPDPAQFGSSDWSLRPVNAAPSADFVIEPIRIERVDGEGWRPEEALEVYPQTTEAEVTSPVSGVIAFVMPDTAAALTLELVYQPPDAEQIGIAVRHPGPAPDPVAVITPSTQPGAPGYVAIEGLPFTVLESSEADELFARPDSCDNASGGYTVSFPDDWYTNTATGSTPACSWFTPQFFEVDASGEAPEGIWITIDIFDGTYGYTSMTEVYFYEEIAVDGRMGRRVEYNPDLDTEPDYRGYHYVVPLAAGGPTLVAETNTAWADDYELAKAILDRVMGSLEFAGE